MTAKVRLVLEIFRKDIERLWWAVLLALSLLAFFAWQDSTRAPYIFPSLDQTGNWLNLALPFAWSLLIALVVSQDPLTGDCQFWVALPCGWRVLLAAKAAFIAAFIQFPYLLACSAILLARGFNPLQHMPHLIWKQLVLLALIAPAVALAAVAKNVAQFMLVLIAAAAGLIFLSDRINRGLQQEPSWDIRWRLALVILVTGAIALTILQFMRRHTMRARMIGAITALVAASLYSWLPRNTLAAIDAALSAAPVGVSTLSVALSPREQSSALARRYYNFQHTTALVSIAFSGLPPDIVTHGDPVSLEVIRANGERYEGEWPSTQDDYRRVKILSSLEPADSGGPAWLVLNVYKPPLWNLLRSGSVTLHGRIFASLYRQGNTVILPAGARTEIAGLGYCVNPPADAQLNRENRISTLECESPEIAPREVRTGVNNIYGSASLLDRNFFSRGPYPRDPWLSPLKRGTTTRQMVTPATWNVRPLTSLGSVIIDYTIPNVDLNQFVVNEPARTEATR